MLVLVECLLWLETLNQPKMFQVDAGKELCLLPKNQLNTLNLLQDYSIGPDSVLPWLILFLKHALSNNVQHKTRCLFNIRGATGEMPQGLLKASLALGLTYQVLRVLEALP